MSINITVNTLFYIMSSADFKEEIDVVGGSGLMLIFCLEHFVECLWRTIYLNDNELNIRA